MKIQLYLSLFVYLVSWTAPSELLASEKPDYHSKYAGQERRAIKSLSADDIEQLSLGKGWGLAKAAELNGAPGPIHVLQMRHKIDLTRQQEKRINAVYDQMKASAIPLGKKFIALEKKLNEGFSQNSMNKSRLRQQLDQIALVRKELRYTHLVAHLETLEILTPQQVTLYNQLRGYDSASPCDHVPEGHDAAMWKKHNGCP